MIQILTRREDGERGAILVLSALILTALVFIAALAVDIGHQSMTKRDLHAIADIAADDAVTLLGTATAYNDAYAAADASATRNKLPNVVPGGTPPFTIPAANANPVVHIGTWNARTSMFTPTDAVNQAAANAVEVIANATYSAQFAPGSSNLTATAIAIEDGQAGVEVGSTALTLDCTNPNYIPDTIFGIATPANGAQCAAQVAGYNGLVSANLTLSQLANSPVAASFGIGTPTQLLNANLTAAQIAQIALSALSSSGGTASEIALLNQMITADGSGRFSGTFQLGKLLGFGVGNGAVFDANSVVNVLNLVTAAPFVALANGTNFISLSVPVNLNLVIGSLSATTTMAIIAAPSTAFGPVGISASTAQLAIKVTVTGTLAGGLVAVNLPLEIDGVGGTGKIVQIACTNPGTVGISGQPTLGQVAIGSWPNQNQVLGNQTVTPAPILTALGSSVLASLSESLGQGTAQTQTWTAANPFPASQVRGPLPVSLGGYFSNGLTAASSNITLSGSGLLGSVATLLGGVAGITNDLGTILGGIVSGPVNQLMSALGLNLNQVDLYNPAYPGTLPQGVLCNVPQLVQ